MSERHKKRVWLAVWESDAMEGVMIFVAVVVFGVVTAAVGGAGIAFAVGIAKFVANTWMGLNW